MQTHSFQLCILKHIERIYLLMSTLLDSLQTFLTTSSCRTGTGSILTVGASLKLLFDTTVFTSSFFFTQSIQHISLLDKRALLHKAFIISLNLLTPGPIFSSYLHFDKLAWAPYLWVFKRTLALCIPMELPHSHHHPAWMRPPHLTTRFAPEFVHFNFQSSPLFKIF